uniref:Ornithine decarboxylase n=1 Tax=Phocoena sinus TaxID=42100 RepID=A0A8C9CUT7_PHOSS
LVMKFDCHFLDESFTAKDILDQNINEVPSEDKDAFYVADLGGIVKKHLIWGAQVTPFYAVKCNDSRTIVKTIPAIRKGFDCTSKTEIQLVQSLRVPPERIIYANPCKQVSQIKYAAKNGVQMMTFDSEVELVKVARAHPKAKLVFQIATDDSKAVCHLSVKFGVTLKTSRLLLEWAKGQDIDVIGVSYHVGHHCTDPETFVQTISDAHCDFDMGAVVGFNMFLLDIGGETTGVINPVLCKYFPSDSGVSIIPEPGRYCVVPVFTLAVNIISSEQTFMYYVNDGVYASFNCILYDHEHVKPLLQKRPKPDEKYYSFSIWRPTCDGLDHIVEHCNLLEMHEGDWMLFENMGVYTLFCHCCHCCFYFQWIPETNHLLCDVRATMATDAENPQP